jgi:LysM repeat protein
MFVRLAILVLVTVVLWAVLARDTGAGSHPTHYRVQPGDTLWSIALEHVGGDPREGVWKIQEANDLEGATIVPGQRLVMP